MNDHLYHQFLSSDERLRVYSDNVLVFSSKRERLFPLLDYLEKFVNPYAGTIMMDKVVGNAAALLMIKARCGQVHSPLGSELATKSLRTYNIRYHFDHIVPYIHIANSAEICPMEELSIDKSPAEFLMALKQYIK